MSQWAFFKCCSFHFTCTRNLYCTSSSTIRNRPCIQCQFEKLHWPQERFAAHILATNSLQKSHRWGYFGCQENTNFSMFLKTLLPHSPKTAPTYVNMTEFRWAFASPGPILFLSQTGLPQSCQAAQKCTRTPTIQASAQNLVPLIHVFQQLVCSRVLQKQPAWTFRSGCFTWASLFFTYVYIWYKLPEDTLHSAPRYSWANADNTSRQ